MSGQTTVQDPPVPPPPSHFPLSWTSAQPRPGIRLITLTGELDILTAPPLLVELHAPENASATHLVINLTEVDFLAAAGINALSDVARGRRRDHTHLVAAPGNTAVVRIIELTGVADVLTLHPDLEQCLRHLDRLTADDGC